MAGTLRWLKNVVVVGDSGGSSDDCWYVLGPDAGSVAATRDYRLRVYGDSMEPALSAGDVILVKTGSEVAADTMVVANRGEDGCVVKYVASFEPGRIELASLNPTYPPFFIARDEHSIVGTVISRFHRM